MLQTHATWLRSQGEQGARAVWRDSDLSGLDLGGADLRYAELRGCRLRNTRLQGARLDFTDLSEAHDLLPTQLAATELRGARLPEELDLATPLAHAAALIGAAGKTLLLLLLAVGYTWLTLATTTDIALLTNASTSPLPIILTELPIAGFYWAAPLILLGLYVYLHLHLQRLWENLAALPAVFPDGRALHERVRPWLVTGLAYAKRYRPALLRLQNAIAIALAWYAVPLTIAALWLRYLTRRDVTGSSFHLVCLILGVVAGALFYRLACRTLRRDSRTPLTVGLSASCLLLATLLSYGLLATADNAKPLDPRRWAPQMLLGLGYHPYADFRDSEVSRYHDAAMALDRVRGADLKNTDLYRLRAANAFMARSDLRAARLRDADLELADLRAARLQESDLYSASLLQTDLSRADLSGADLRDAELLLAKLDGASLRRADLRGAFLNRARLRKADLSQADLRDADLRDADLSEARLQRARLANIDLRGADLRGARGLQCSQLLQCLIDDDTRLPSYLNCPQLCRQP